MHDLVAAAWSEPSEPEDKQMTAAMTREEAVSAAAPPARPVRAICKPGPAQVTSESLQAAQAPTTSPFVQHSMKARANGPADVFNPLAHFTATLATTQHPTAISEFFRQFAAARQDAEPVAPSAEPLGRGPPLDPPLDSLARDSTVAAKPPPSRRRAGQPQRAPLSTDSAYGCDTTPAWIHNTRYPRVSVPPPPLPLGGLQLALANSACLSKWSDCWLDAVVTLELQAIEHGPLLEDLPEFGGAAADVPPLQLLPGARCSDSSDSSTCSDSPGAAALPASSASRLQPFSMRADSAFTAVGASDGSKAVLSVDGATVSGHGDALAAAGVQITETEARRAGARLGIAPSSPRPALLPAVAEPIGAGHSAAERRFLLTFRDGNLERRFALWQAVTLQSVDVVGALALALLLMLAALSTAAPALREPLALALTVALPVVRSLLPCWMAPARYQLRREVISMVSAMVCVYQTTRLLTPAVALRAPVARLTSVFTFQRAIGIETVFFAPLFMGRLRFTKLLICQTLCALIAIANLWRTAGIYEAAGVASNGTIMLLGVVPHVTVGIAAPCALQWAIERRERAQFLRELRHVDCSSAQLGKAKKA